MRLLAFHDDLMTNGQFNTWEFCSPIFIANQFGLLLQKPDAIVPKGSSQPHVRNGTLTFVSYRGSIYGLTCRHVTRALDLANMKQKKSLVATHGQNSPFHYRLQMHFMVSHGNRQVHINAQFHDLADPFTGDGPDIAIAKVNPATVKAIGRRPIPLASDFSEAADLTNVSGVATGYPERKRVARGDGPIRNFSFLAVSAAAPFLHTDGRLCLHTTLQQRPEVDNLSGMSGGPILWSSASAWGLAGIVTEGRDILGEGQGILEGPAIWIEGEAVTGQLLTSLIGAVPEFEDPLPDLSKMTVGPGINSG